MKSLYERLNAYRKEGIYPYHMPGHKRRLSGEMPEDFTAIDITEIPGFDNLHQPEEILKELMDHAAELAGARETFYLVNGSTCGILSAISAATSFGGHMLVTRNCHKSVYHGAYLRQIHLHFLYPNMIEQTDIAEAITPEAVEDALEKNPQVEAVLIVSPTYEGRIADVKTIAEIVHQRGIPLIVDEAHGAHLGWSESVAPNSIRCGADLVIQSVHKTLPAMTQTALLHVQGDLVNVALLCRFLQIYQTSSPSYVLMASIDNALRIMEKQGVELTCKMQERFAAMLETLNKECKHLRFLPLEKEEAGGYPRQDVGKLTILSGDSGLSGQEIYDRLQKDYGLQLEMAAGSYCLAMFTVGDGEEAYDRMEKALLAIDADYHPNQVTNAMEIIFDFCEEKEGLPLYQAWDMETEEIPFEQAIGRYVGEFVNLYPPGIPILVPGEQLTEKKFQKIIDYRNKQLQVQGLRQQGKEYFLKVLLWGK